VNDVGVLVKQERFNSPGTWSCWDDSVVRYAYTSRIER